MGKESLHTRLPYLLQIDVSKTRQVTNLMKNWYVKGAFVLEENDLYIKGALVLGENDFRPACLVVTENEIFRKMTSC